MTNGKLNDDLIYEILSVVEEIPEGCVASYGQIARLIGKDKNRRLVGKALSLSQYYGSFPCHRVVNRAGRCAPSWYEQESMLKFQNLFKLVVAAIVNNANTDGYTFEQLKKDVRDKKGLTQKIKDIFDKKK